MMCTKKSANYTDTAILLHGSAFDEAVRYIFDYRQHIEII